MHLLYCQVHCSSLLQIIYDKVTPRDSFVATIENLMAKKAKFDFIFIETDGLADPGPVASVFWVIYHIYIDCPLNVLTIFNQA
jgi:G3E family GTPase